MEKTERSIPSPRLTSRTRARTSPWVNGTGSANDQWLLTDAGATEGVFSLDFRVDTSGSATTEQVLVFFRYQDSQNYWQLLLDASADTWTLRHRNSGVFTIVGKVIP